jgi:hypothetical protein
VFGFSGEVRKMINDIGFFSLLNFLSPFTLGVASLFIEIVDEWNKPMDNSVN